MKISFIVPVYNGERYLRACVDSILAQSVRDIELVAVNNGSTDGVAAFYGASCCLTACFTICCGWSACRA